MMRRALLHDKRAAVALWIGLSLPTLLTAASLGIEVSSWSVVQVELQSTADAAALAGGMNYKLTSSGQSATGAAANVAEVNGITGTSTRSWSAATQTLSDNQITAAVVSGIQNASDTAIKVTVRRSVPLLFANIFSSLGSVTVSASAWAELVPSGPQPALVALQSGCSSGGISMSGYTALTDPSASIVSNAGITLSGSGNLDTDGIYYACSLSIPFWVPVTGTESQNTTTIPDPYLSYSALQTALGQLSAGAGTSLATSGSTTQTINPGTYSQFTTSGYTNLTLNSGLYLINGPINFSGNTTLTGTGVTIINSGSITVGGSFTGNLTAPGTSPTGGGVPGILMASTGSSVSFSGGFSFPFTGVLYFPDASVNLSGSTTLGSSGCAELIGGSLTLSGSASFSGSCSSYGAPSYGSSPGSFTVSLVK
jgi:hypothetical protein